MLLIHELTSAPDAKHYYAAADYYSQGQETVGMWGGKLAPALGLSGKVSKAAFDNLCDNLRPDGSKLTIRTTENRRIGYDFTVSVPKSASLVRAFAGAELAAEMDAARDRAIAGMMALVEADIQCRVRRKGADFDRRTGNMLWAAFHHSTSRPVEGQPPDPHDHTHLVSFNATMDPEEHRIKAGQFGNLKRDGEFYSAVFDGLYAREMETLGFRIHRQGGKRWEIAGILDSLISKFKKRTDEIEDEAARRGITNATRKAELGAKTRKRKQKELTPDELRQAWDDQLDDSDRDALAGVYAHAVPADRKVTAAEAVAFAIAHLSEQRSVFAERELLKVALWRGLGDVSLEEIARELPRQGIVADDIDGRRMVTTKTLQDEERYLVRLAARGRGAVQPLGMPEGLTQFLPNGKKLNDGQWEVAQGLLGSSNTVTVLEGPAGAGKSFTLQKFDEGMRMHGQHVTYLATTAPAVKVLAKDRFDAHTVAHFLRDQRMQAAAAGGRVVVDETSLLGHRDAVKLFKLAEALDLKLVLVGDPLQHGSVPRGALMRILKDYAALGSYRLTRIMRQEDPEYRAAAQRLSEGRTLAGFQALDAKDWVKEIGDDDARCRAMATEYLLAIRDGASCLVVSPTHREAAAITAEIRDQLRTAALLGKDEREFSRLVDINASEAQRGLASTYRTGDVLIFHQNAKGGYVKGQRVTVSDPAKVPLGEASKYSVYRPEKIMLAVGDKIRFTGTVTARDKSKLRNGDTHTITAITRGGRLRLDNGTVVDGDCGLFRSAFCETSFGAQGQTVQRVILGMSADSVGAMNQEQMYVSSSRAKERMTLYTDDKDAIRRAILKSSQKLAALDLRAMPEPAAARKVPLRGRLRKYFERRRRDAALERMRAAYDLPSGKTERQVLSYARGR
jgi:conjugative relaxase-like TrwC/TraI family protein